MDALVVTEFLTSEPLHQHKQTTTFIRHTGYNYIPLQNSCTVIEIFFFLCFPDRCHVHGKSTPVRSCHASRPTYRASLTISTGPYKHTKFAQRH
jgi:hypothetical protein